MKITTKNIVLGVLLIIGLWISSGLLINFFVNPDRQGVFGDMFGSINALFSGLALFGIIISILIQQNELKLQRTELELTRDEFKVNRITNILFRQIELLNGVIDNTRFAKGKLDIIAFIVRLNEYSTINKNKFITQNSGETAGLITKIQSLMENFEKVLANSKLNEDEILQMKSLFFQNINPHFISLIHHEIDDIKNEGTDLGELEDLNQQIQGIRMQRLKYILEYNK